MPFINVMTGDMSIITKYNNYHKKRKEGQKLSECEVMEAYNKTKMEEENI